MSTKCFHMSTKCFHTPKHIYKLYILFKPSSAQEKPPSTRTKTTVVSHAKASHQDHEDHAHEGPEEDDQGQKDKKSKPMKAMPMKSHKAMKTQQMKAMKTMKATAMKTPPKKEDQPMDVPWNGRIQCASAGCKSWIYVRKSQWYAKCTHCNRPWVSSLQQNGITMPDPQLSLNKFLAPKYFLM